MADQASSPDRSARAAVAPRAKTTAPATASRRAGNAAHAQRIEAAMRQLWAGRSVVELRAFGAKKWHQWSGYYQDPATFARDAASLEGRARVVYFTLNDVNPEARFRSPDGLRELPRDGRTTSDDEITRRLYLPLDFDPKRLADTPSSDEQHELSLGRAKDVRANLLAEGWPEPALLDTGNGGALLYRIDLPATHDGLVERCLKGLDFMYSDDLVAVDTSVANASRIWKVPFTVAGAKGSHSAERPHRRSALLEAPDVLEIVSIEQLKALAAILPAEPIAKRARNVAGQTFDIDRWIAEHLPDLGGPKPWQRGRKWTGRCAWNSAHTNASFYIVQFESGAIAAGCHHNGCQGLGWAELRDHLEPGHREKRSQAAERRGLQVVEEPEWLAQEVRDDPGPVVAPASLDDRRFDGDHGPTRGEPEWEWKRLSVIDALTAEPKPLDWLAAGLCAKGEAVVLTASTGLAKTYISMQIAIDLATGRPVLGVYVVPGPRKVLWIDEEMGIEMLSDRLCRQTRGCDLRERELELVHANLDIRHQQGLSLGDGEQFAVYDKTLREGRYDLVVMDSMVALTPGDENKADDARAFYKRCIAPYKGSLGTAFWVLAHPPKPHRDAAPGAQHDPRGSGDKINAVDRSFYLELDSETITADSFVLKVILNRRKMRQGGSVTGQLILIDGPEAQPVRVYSLGSLAGEKATQEIGKVNTCAQDILVKLRGATNRMVYQPQLNDELLALGFDKRNHVVPARDMLVNQGIVRMVSPIKGAPEGRGAWLQLTSKADD